jgi:hypothetical protein
MQSNILYASVLIGIIMALSVTVNAQYCTTKEAFALEAKTFKFDTTSTRGLADNFYLWNVGATIKVRFMNGTPEQHIKVMALAKEWEKHANIKFVKTDAEPSNVRVEFSEAQENYSLLGIDANQADPEEHTMHLELGLFNDPVRLKRTVVHEFGHALGFMHEHSSPVSGIEWNKDTMYKQYAQFGWDKQMVDAQIFRVYDKRYTNGTKYDPKSIMHYPIPAWHTTNGYNVGWNTELSEGDKELAALMYPFTGERPNEVPRINILEFTTTLVKADKAAGGINLFPSFYMTTAGVTGDVYLCVMLLDKNGKAIKATDDKYNVGGIVGTYKSYRMAPGKKLSVNKESPEELALFIPYDKIPNTPDNSEIKVVFRTFVSDGQELKSIYASSPVAHLMGSR